MMELTKLKIAGKICLFSTNSIIMKSPLPFIILIYLFLFNGCSLIKLPPQKGTKDIILKYREYINSEDKYQYITLSVFKGYKYKKVVYEGFYEYQFQYSDSLILYVSSDIYNGSRLNFKNTYNIGIDSYSKSRSLGDTIKNEGKQANNKLWLEYILGDIVIGYINLPENRETEFKKVIKSLKWL